MTETRKLLVNSQISCFADEIASSLDRQIEVMKDLGIQWLELRSADGRGVAGFTKDFALDIKKRLDEAGIKVSAIGSPIGNKTVAEISKMW